MLRALALYAALIAAELSSSPAAAAAPRSVELPVYMDGAPSPWAFVVPVEDGWRPVTEQGSPVAALVRRYSRGCELFLQVLAEPGPGSFLLAKALARARGVGAAPARRRRRRPALRRQLPPR